MGGPNAGFFEPALQDTRPLTVPTLVIYEVYRHALWSRGLATANAHYLQLVSANVVELSGNLAAFAATLAHQHKLAMADAIVLATAREHRAQLWTQDIDLGAIPGVQYRPKVKT